MPLRKHTPEEIIGKLREVEIVLAQGGTTAEACRRIAVSEQTYYRWRKEYGGLKPFKVIERRGKPPEIVFDAAEASGRERTVLGGLKTKSVDIVVTKEGIGPVLAVSCKAMTGALRNLTNRMEETIGECTNLHITYPALVFGYAFAVVAHRADSEAAELAADADQPLSSSRQLSANDMAIRAGGEPVESLIRFHAALSELTGRHGIRDEVSRYEAICMLLIEAAGDGAGSLIDAYPPPSSKLRLQNFFSTLYQRYEERFVYGAPKLQPTTRRNRWSPTSPAFAQDLLAADRPRELDYEVRLATDAELVPFEPAGELGEGGDR